MRAAAPLLALGAGLVVLARSEAWHTYRGSGFSAPDGWTADVLLVLPAAVAALALAGLAVRRLLRAAAAAATALVVVLGDQLVRLGGPSDAPDAGAWLAGGAGALLACGVALVLPRRAARLVLPAALTALALALCLPPDSLRHDDGIEVIR